MSHDVIIIGSGPNGLAAAIALATEGASVLVLEGHDRPGGGMRTEARTLPGFQHDVCSACHPMGILSPYLRTLPLAEHGLVWRQSDVSVAHPLDDDEAVLLSRSVAETAAGLGVDEAAYHRLVGPLVPHGHRLLSDALGPLRLPRHPLVMARFGLRAVWSARGLARLAFRGERARALMAGCAGHAVAPLTTPLTAAMAMVFLLSAHLEDWPVVQGGSEALARALVSLLEARGGEVRTGVRVADLSELPPSRAVIFDTDPGQLATLAQAHLPARYRRRLGRYRYGPGSFKVDWALSGPIPWRDPRVGRAATVHLGGGLEAITRSEAQAFAGQVPDRPFVLLVQQSMLDPTRAPEGQHTGYAYCHVPHGSTVDMREAIEAEVERHAPGFRRRILAAHTTDPAGFRAHNPNYVGGVTSGGATLPTQLFTRPVARLDPYSTPHPAIFLGSAATPPGGGVHGMGGYFAARSVLRALPGLTSRRW